MSTPDLAKMIDHTLLKPDATKEQIVQLCAEAKQHGFASVCVNPVWVRTAARELRGTSVLVCTVVGFPLGATPTDVKVFEARNAVLNGAHEVDMVINIAAAKAGDEDALIDDISAVADTVHTSNAILKVIIETSLLTDEQKKLACRASKAAGADFVKTSTGFNGGGATVEDVKLMKEVVGDELEVKASGGVRSREDALAMVEAGATRIGASSGIAIVSGGEGTEAY